MNVGLALHHLAERRADASLNLAPLGGPAYEAIDHEFEQLGVPRRWVRTRSPTRVCTTIVDGAAGTATELVENAGPLTAEELTEFEDAFASAAADAQVVVLTGSLPRGVPADFFRRLLRQAPCPAVLDIRGAELLAALDARPLVVKPNRDELAHTLGTPIRTHEDLKLAMSELHRRGAQTVIVTAGAGEVRLRSAAGFRQFTPPGVDRIVNPIGCGDAMAAGMAWAIGRGLDVESAVGHGLAAAAANLSTLLPSDFDGQRERLTRRKG